MQELNNSDYPSCLPKIQNSIYLYFEVNENTLQSPLELILKLINFEILKDINNRILLIRFLKGGYKDYSENIALSNLRKKYPLSIEIINSTTERILTHSNLQLEDYNDAEICWRVAKNFLRSGQFSLIILDELSSALNLNLINFQEVIETLEQFKTENSQTKVAITGFNPPTEIMEIVNFQSNPLS